MASTDTDTRREVGPRTRRRSLTSTWRPCTIFTTPRPIRSLRPRLASTDADTGSLTSAAAATWGQRLDRTSAHADTGRQTWPRGASTHCNAWGQPRTAGGHWPRAPGHTHPQPGQPRVDPGFWLLGATDLDTQPSQFAHIGPPLLAASLNLNTAAKIFLTFIIVKERMLILPW